jgi:hypothetical protein
MNLIKQNIYSKIKIGLIYIMCKPDYEISIFNFWKVSCRIIALEYYIDWWFKKSFPE